MPSFVNVSERANKLFNQVGGNDTYHVLSNDDVRAQTALLQVIVLADICYELSLLREGMQK